MNVNHYSYDLVCIKRRQLSTFHAFDVEELCLVMNAADFEVADTFIIPNDPMYRWIKW
jgi:hypothetical protein